MKTTPIHAMPAAFQRLLILALATLAAPITALPEVPEPEAGGAVILSGGPDGTSLRAIGEFVPGTKIEEALFEIGSLTKVFTGLLLAQSVVDGTVSLQTRISEILPEGFAFADPRIGDISLAALASHTSGLPRLPDNLAASANPANPYAHYDKSLLLDFLRSSRLEGKSTPADRAARYSNLGFGLLGYLLEEAHAQSYETLIRRKILEPLGMENTFLKVPYAAVHRQATPYSGISPVSQWDFKVLAGTGALWSTAPDLARFAECLLYPERFDFSDSVSLLKKPLAAMGGASIGLGLLQENIWQYDRLYHDGGTGGFSSSFVLTPSTGQYFVVLANQSNGFASRVANKLMQASVSAGTSETPSPTEAQPGLKTVNLALYQGKYTMGPNSTFHVQKFDDHLYVRLTGQLALPVRLTETDRFVYSDVEASLEFIRDPSGKIKSLSLHQNGRVIPAPKTGDNPGRPFLLPDGQAEEYAGKYALGPEQIFEVRALNRQLLVQLTGQPALPVLPSGTDRFEYDVVEAFLIFNRDPSGEVSGLVLHQNGLELPAPKQ